MNSLYPAAITITGLPGTGKTRLAIALGNALTQDNQSVLILHTDILKVTLRHCQWDQLRGPGYGSDCEEKARLVRPILHRQAQKAEQDGYTLIIEGTLAVGFQCPPGPQILLTLPEVERLQRIKTKPRPAQQGLAETDLTPYRQMLEKSTTKTTLKLDASQTTAQLVRQLLAILQ